MGLNCQSGFSSFMQGGHEHVLLLSVFNLHGTILRQPSHKKVTQTSSSPSNPPMNCRHSVRAVLLASSSSSSDQLSAAPLVATSADPSRGLVSWVSPFTKWSCPSLCREGCGRWQTRPSSTGPASRCWWTCLSGACSPPEATPQSSVSRRRRRRRLCLLRYFRFLSVDMHPSFLDVCGFFPPPSRAAACSELPETGFSVFTCRSLMRRGGSADEPPPRRS